MPSEIAQAQVRKHLNLEERVVLPGRLARTMTRFSTSRSKRAVSRFLAGFLYGVTPMDPITFGAVALLLSLVVLVAACVPALRAARSDPLVALRYE